MKHAKSGFTIVELIVVIAIIGILAAIIVVSYNGISARARSTQTISAAEQWTKVFQIYKTRNNGTLPTDAGCLGSSYGFGVSNTTSGTGPQCRQHTDSIANNNTLNAALAKYITTRPSPAMVTASNSSTQWARGIYYKTSSNTGYLGVVFDGSNTATSCPKIGSLNAETAVNYTNRNSLCTYSLGSTTGY